MIESCYKITRLFVLAPGRGGAASFPAVFYSYRREGMYSNELKAVSGALEALDKALRGEEFNVEAGVEGGRAYDGARELCGIIIAAAQSAKSLADRVAALEPA
jgi:hypothetical protein